MSAAVHGDRVRRAVTTIRGQLLLIYGSSPSSPAEAGTAGLTGVSVPDSTHAFWLGANLGASIPSLISRVTAKRLNCVAGMNKRSLLANPSDIVSTSPSAAETTPLWPTRATSAA